MVASTHHTSTGTKTQSVPTMTEALSALRSSKKSSSSSSSSSSTPTNTSTTTSKPNYASSIASTTTSTSTYSLDKPLLPPSTRPAPPTPRRTLGQRAKKLWSDVGSSPAADYDRQQLAKGEMTDGQKAFSKIDFPATLGDARDVNKGQVRTH